MWGLRASRTQDSYATLYRFLCWFWEKNLTVLQSIVRHNSVRTAESLNPGGHSTKGSLSNDDGDGNKNGKRAKGLDKQNNNFARSSCFFCTFLCRRCTTMTWKWLISRFVEDGNTRQQLSFSFPELWCSPSEFSSKKIANLWRIHRDGISAIKFEAARIHFLTWTWRFRSRRRRCYL